MLTGTLQCSTMDGPLSNENHTDNDGNQQDQPNHPHSNYHTSISRAAIRGIVSWCLHPKGVRASPHLDRWHLPYKIAWRSLACWCMQNRSLKEWCDGSKHTKEGRQKSRTAEFFTSEEATDEGFDSLTFSEPAGFNSREAAERSRNDRSEESLAETQKEIPPLSFAMNFLSKSAGIDLSPRAGSSLKSTCQDVQVRNPAA